MTKNEGMMTGRRRLLTAFGATLALATVAPASVRAAVAEAKDGGLPEAWRAAERIVLWPDGPPSGGFKARPVPPDTAPIYVRNVAVPELRVFRPQRSNGRALLSIPGGAYTFVSIGNEGLDVAQRMTAKGYTVFVLLYRLPDEGWVDRPNVPLQDAQRAVRIIRSAAARFSVAPNRIGVVGFSAGGHLAASLATGFDEALGKRRDAIDALDARPDAVGLVYPVISHEAGVGHAESTLRLLGPNPPAGLFARRSPALHVGARTPPTFLVHAIDDDAVPVQNSLLMLDALRRAGRPCEAHLFQEGGHGFGIGRSDLPAHHWPDLFGDWLDRQWRG